MESFFSEVKNEDEKAIVEEKLRSLIKLTKNNENIVYDTYEGLFYILGDVKNFGLLESQVENFWIWLDKYYGKDEIEGVSEKIYIRDHINVLKEKINIDIELQEYIKCLFKEDDNKKFELANKLISKVLENK
jgi:hypothetical protein